MHIHSVVHSYAEDTTSEAPYEVSSELCAPYSNGGYCARDNKGGCPLVHDANRRRDALQEKRLKKARARQQENYTSNELALQPSNKQLQAQQLEQPLHNVRSTSPASREKVQNEYNKVKAAPATSSQGTNVKQKCGNVKPLVTAFTRPQQPAASDSSTEKTLAKLSTSISGESSTSVPDDFTVDVNIGKEDDGRAHQRSHCVFFLKGRCKKKDKCFFLHDYVYRLQVRKANRNKLRDNVKSGLEQAKVSEEAARKDYVKEQTLMANTENSKVAGEDTVTEPRKTRMKPSQREKQNLQRMIPVKETQLKASISYSAAASKGDLAVPTPEPKVKPNPSLPTRPSENHSVVATTLPPPAWDPFTLRSWAVNNLRMDTATRYMAKYIKSGRIPIKCFELTSEKDTGGNLLTFHQFGFLPTELRAQIWNHAIEENSDICRIQFNWLGRFGEVNQRPRFSCQHEPPRYLLVNQECRFLAQKHYELTFGTQHMRPTTWFNFKKDDLFIVSRSAQDFTHLTDQFIRHDRHRIERLILPLRDWVHSKYPMFAAKISKYEGLKKLIFLVGNTKEDSKWADNTRHYGKRIQADVIKAFCKRQIQRNGNVNYRGSMAPVVSVRVISGLEAHYYKIDGIIW